MSPELIRVVVALIIGLLLIEQFRRSAVGSRRRWAFVFGAAAMLVIATSNLFVGALLPLMIVGGGLAVAAVWLLWQAYQRGELADRFECARDYLVSERRRYDEQDRGGSHDG